jgi:hypothetical protein
MSGSKMFLQLAAVVLLVCACAVPVWVPPVDHPADPGAQNGTRTNPTALKRYRESAAAVETAQTSPSENKSEMGDEKDSHRHHGDQDVGP